jgi:hypothetical protein
MLSILPILAILFLLIIAAVTYVIYRLRPGFPRLWLLVIIGTFLVWLITLITGLYLPQSIVLIPTQPENIFSTTLVLLVDEFSWPYAFSLATLSLSVMLTAMSRAGADSPKAWAGSLAMTAIGMLAVYSANPLTLVVTWAAMDMVEYGVLLTQIHSSHMRRQVIYAFSVRALSIILICWGAVIEQALGIDLTFMSFAPNISLFLLLASGLRLGVLPFHVPFLMELPLRRGLGTVIRAVPVAASLMVLTRVAMTGIAPEWITLLLVLSGLSALLSGIAWASEADELGGRPYWILGMASLAFASAVIYQPETSLAWGLALLLPGSMLFVASMRERRHIWLLVLGILVLSGVPYTPTWAGVNLYTYPTLFPLLLLLGAQGFLLAGYVRYSLASRQALSDLGPWANVAYLLGVLLLPLTHLMLGWWLGLISTESPWWPGITSLGIAVILIVLSYRRFGRLSNLAFRFGNILKSIFSFGWLYTPMVIVFRVLDQLFMTITHVLEGEGGVLWALLIMILLISISLSLFT